MKPGELRGEGGETRDANIYFEDAIWRPSMIAEVYNGAAEGFDRREIRADELDQLRDIAEHYEEQLYTAMAEGEQEGGKKDNDVFNPKVFDMDEDEAPPSRGKRGVKTKA